jgi:chemotaxis protein methyltransferase CheR
MSALKEHEHVHLDNVVREVSHIVSKISGNILGPKQAHMVQTRISKRMLDLKIHSPDEYLEYLNGNKDSETKILVGLLTTHHTFFFREFIHFQHLQKDLPRLVESVKARGGNTLNVWSAASSRGQEVYSIAMFLDFHLPIIDKTIKYKILGTDIDHESVAIAQNGVFNKDELNEAPLNLLGSHWAKGTGDIANFVKAKSTIKDNCTFRQLNLLEGHTYPNGQKFDVIFCRNVFIYFEQEQVRSIVQNLLKCLTPDGNLFSGISESLANINLPIENVGPAVYAPEGSQSKDAPATTRSSRPSTQKSTKKLINVLCVDDSKSILKILGKILTKDKGFNVVGTAENGLEAHEMISKGGIDVMTLDIHMPEMDGLTYLQKHVGPKHPPVIMMSSVSRTESDLALKALERGATDYIEKPELSNITERGEEIRTKLQAAFDYHDLNLDHTLSFDKQFKKHSVITSPDTKLRVIFSRLADKKRLFHCLSEIADTQPPTVVFFEGNKGVLETFAQETSSKVSSSVKCMFSGDKLESNTIYYADFASQFDEFKSNYSERKTSFMVFGDLSKKAKGKLLTWRNTHLLAEDIGEKDKATSEVYDKADDVVPYTSFIYMSCEYLSRE